MGSRQKDEALDVVNAGGKEVHIQKRERNQNTSYWMLNHAESIGGNT